MVSGDRGEFVYAPSFARRGGIITLSGDESHHLLRVRRVRAGQIVWATDGEGLVHECRLESEGRLAILAVHEEWGEPPHRIVLLMAVLKGDGNRDVVDTATQLGAARILFFPAERSEGRLAPDKLSRLERAAVAAVKQCGRARLPQISLCASLAEAVAAAPAGADCFIAHPAPAEVRTRAPLAVTGESVLLIGPEGGLSADEVASAQAEGFSLLSLGARRLRSQTAVAAGLSVLLAAMAESGRHA